VDGENGTSVKVTLGATIRELRLRRKLSQLQLAELAGLDRTFVNGVENGAHNPTAVSLVRLAQALGVVPAQLFKQFDKKFMERLEFK